MPNFFYFQDTHDDKLKSKGPKGRNGRKGRKTKPVQPVELEEQFKKVRLSAFQGILRMLGLHEQLVELPTQRNGIARYITVY